MASKCKQGEECFKVINEGEYDPNRPINQQAVASYVREAIWPGNKMLPKSWSKWRDDKRSLC
jgi:hypothetical protein